MVSDTQTTRILARVAGPFIALIGAAVALRGEGLGELLSGLEREPGAIFSLGLITLLLGLVMLVLHHRWRSPLQIVLSAFGVLMVVRGAVFLVAPGLLTWLVGYAQPMIAYAWLAGLAAVLLGLWLAYEGYFRRSAG
jgi:hypothetical protein